MRKHQDQIRDQSRINADGGVDPVTVLALVPGGDRDRVRDELLTSLTIGPQIAKHSSRHITAVGAAFDDWLICHNNRPF